MSVEIHNSGTGVRFFMTTIDRQFGPQMTDFEEAERFSIFLGGKPESFNIAHLEILYENWNKAINDAYQDGWNDAKKGTRVNAEIRGIVKNVQQRRC